ncbi:unnamed protein product, partial [Oppiella nova]
MKQDIQLFYVFDDSIGYNILFVTKDDQVFGLGVNSAGQLGLGHNTAVHSAIAIFELSHLVGEATIMDNSDMVIQLPDTKLSMNPVNNENIYKVLFNELSQIGTGGFGTLDNYVIKWY